MLECFVRWCFGDIQHRGTVFCLTVSDGYLEQIKADVRVAGKRVVRFKDGSFKEYPVGFHYDLPVLKKNLGGDSRLDNFAAEVVTGFSVSDSFQPPVLDISDSFFRSYGMELVGHGQPLNVYCNKWFGIFGCLNVDCHMGEHAGLIPFRMAHHHCHNYRCPESRMCALDCYFYGACVPEARNIDERLRVLAEKFGKPVEVGMISLPENLYDASDEVKRLWTVRALKSRGWEGFNLIRHPFRYKSSYRDANGRFHLANWYYAEHFHVLGFLSSDYSRCRECPDFAQWHNRYGSVNSGCNRASFCSGFEQTTRLLRLKDGFVNKIFEKRENFYKTAVYELSHAGFKIGVKHVVPSSWYGSCKGVKVEYKRRKLVCPEEACKREFVKIGYSGNRVIVTNPKSPSYVSDGWTPYVEIGEVVWHE